MSGMIIYGKYESVEAAGSGEMINKEIRAVYTKDTISGGYRSDNN